MSACSTFTEHVWKPGECKNCFKPKSLHKLPPASEKAPLTHSNLKTNANHSNNHRTRSTGNFRPPVAKKPTIAVKPTMMVVDGQGMCAETGISEHCENKQVVGWNRNKKIMNNKPLNNNNDDEIEGYSQVHRPYETNDHGNKMPNNNNNGLSEVLKEIAGLGTPQLSGKDVNSRECFLGRISHCYKQSLERKIPPSCMVGEMKESQGKHVILSGSEEVISNEGGRFCYPEFSSGDESEDDAFFGSIQGEHESWDESDEELLAMEIRMRGQPRFANFRANTLSPVRYCVDKKWNTVPLRNKSLQRICAVDYDDSYDEILNGYGEDGVILYGPESMRSMVSSDSTSPDSSLTESSRSGTTSNSFQKLCNGGLSPSTPIDTKSNDPGYENLRGVVHIKDSGVVRGNSKVHETHKAVLALKLEEKGGRIAVQTEKQEVTMDHIEVSGQTLTVSIVPTEEQAKPYRVVNLEQPLCKPYTIVDVSAAMVGEQLESKVDHSKQKKSTPTTPNSQTTPSTPSTNLSPTLLTTGQVNANLKKSSAIRYQEVWTSSTSPRQKIPKVELVTHCTGPVIPPRRNSHKSAPTSPTATNISSKTIPVKSPNLSEIKFNSYNNAGMPPFPIIIHDEPSYARSCKNAIKVPIVINPNAYDNLAIYKSFLGTNGEMTKKEKTTSIVSSTYEEIETGAKEPECVVKPIEFTQVKRVPSTTERKMGSVAKKVKELNSSVNKDHTSPQRNINSDRSSPSRSQKTTPEEISKTEVPLRPVLGAGSSRENANTVLSQIVASIQPPQSPPGTPQAGPKACSVEELYSLPPDAGTTDTLVRPKSLFTQQTGGVNDVPRSIDGACNQTHKEALLSKPTSVHYANPVIGAQNIVTAPKSDQGPPFPPPRSTSSPYHASNLLQRHFSNWSKPTSPSKATEAESILHSETRRVVDAKPKRWISFKSFFRRKKTDDEEEREREREKGKLVGLDGTVIHMLPPPPVQRHHWFSEAKTEDNEKPSIVFMYRCESTTTDSSIDPSMSKEEDNNSRVKETWGAAYNSSADAKGQSADLPPPPPPPPSETISPVPDGARADDAVPLAPRAGPFKQDSGGSGSSTSVTPASPPNGTRHHDERETGSDLSDISPGSATYSNLGHSRLNMIPHKQPRQIKAGVSDDAIAFGQMTDPELPCESQPTPPPLPKKTIARANTEPTSQDSLKGSAENNLGVANPTYDIDPNWDTGSACSSLSSDIKVLDTESGDSLDRPVMKGRVSTSVGNSVSSLSALTVKERGSSSMDSLGAKHHLTGKHGRSIQKPQRQALYRGIENREEVVGKIRSLHTDSLKKLAIRCEDLFMAGQKNQLRFGVDSWSDFRLASDKPCCEAGDAIYYTASYAKDPLNNYAVKICKSKAKESQRQYYHSLAVRQSLSVNFNIQQDCGHFLAAVPVRLLPWEDPNAPDEEEVAEEEGEEEEGEEEGENEQAKGTKKIKKDLNPRTAPLQNGNFNSMGTISKQRSRVVVITREVPFQTVAEFVEEARIRHTKNPDLYERQVCLLLLQLCSGLEHLKPYHVTHCDLRLENLLLVPFRPGGGLLNFEPVEVNPNATCPARLLVSNFSQAKQKSRIMDSEVLRDQSRLAPEIITGTQYKKCDEFQTGILIYEMLHLSNPFEENPELKEKEYTRADLPLLPHRSLYSRGLQQLANCLLNPNPSERILISDAKDMLRCLLWGPREDLLLALGSVSGTTQRDAVLQNWLDIKRTLLMIKFAEKSLDKESGVGLEDWLCSQYLAFATSDSLRRIVRLMHQY